MSTNSGLATIFDFQRVRLFVKVQHADVVAATFETTPLHVVQGHGWRLLDQTILTRHFYFRLFPVNGVGWTTFSWNPLVMELLTVVIK
jgi:hypothetical protein